MYALEGINVIDLTRLAPGPYAGMLLGDMGADILKVEEPGPPTIGRRAAASSQPQPTDEELEWTAAFSPTARNKRSIALNLKDERALTIFYRLIETADVVIEGFRPGVAKRLKIDYDTLSKLNPRLVYGSVTGYGQYGPYSHLAGHDINYISQGGLLALIGNSPDERPTIPLNYVADLAGGGAQLAFGIVCALLARHTTGRGQYIDASMSDGTTQLIGGTLAGYFQTGIIPRRGTDRLAGTKVHYNVYQCRDGKWLSVGSLEPYFYENFVKAIGREDWLTEEFAPNERHAEMIAEARHIFLTRDRDDWFDHLNQTDQCAMKILDADDFADDPHVKAREMVVELEHPKFGPVRQIGFTPKMSGTPAGFRNFGPTLGQHTDEVLTQLGYTNDQIRDLRETGAVR